MLHISNKNIYFLYEKLKSMTNKIIFSKGQLITVTPILIGLIELAK